jgi:transposase InsO family protein
VSKCKARRFRRRGLERRIYGPKLIGRLGLVPQIELSRPARARLDYLAWHRAHGANVALTCRHFAIARSTFYRWQARHDRSRLASLEDRSSRPAHRRRPTWTLEQLAAVKALRLRYPRWGKDKLVVLLRRTGVVLSVSMVGRILTRLAHTGELHEPRFSAISARKRRALRPHAVRKPAGWRIARPGDLVQLDTLDVRPLPGLVLKQFTARDVVSRWDVVELRRSASAAGAMALLDALAARMPFAVRAIQVDNGSEFMAGFETACASRGIALFVLPPRSPKLNGCVERANRTHTEEFYEVTEAAPELEPLAAALRSWENTYNTVRPHQALGYLTPAEYLASIDTG